MDASEHRNGHLHRRMKQALEALGYIVATGLDHTLPLDVRRRTVVLKALEAKDFPTEGATEAIEIDGCLTIERTLVDAFLIGRPVEDWDDLGKAFREGHLCTCGHHRFAHLRSGKAACKICRKHSLGACRKFEQVLAMTDAPSKAVQRYAYYVTFAKYIPGDRETPPDCDIIDVAAFRHMHQAVSVVLDHLHAAAQAYFMLDWSEEERGLEEGELAYCDECEDVKLADDVKNCGEAGNICKDCLDAARRRGLELQEAHAREMAKFCAKCGVNLRQEKDELCPSCRKEEDDDAASDEWDPCKGKTDCSALCIPPGGPSGRGEHVPCLPPRK